MMMVFWSMINIPTHFYFVQVQLQLEVLDLEVAHFVQYRPATTWTEEEFDLTVVPRDRQWFHNSLPVFAKFYNEWQALKQKLDDESPEASALRAALETEFEGRKRAPRPPPPPKAFEEWFTTPYTELPAGDPDALCEDSLFGLVNGGVLENELDESMPSDLV